MAHKAEYFKDITQQGMSVPKAIEILTFMGTPEFEGNTEDIQTARTLGIEALKRHIETQQYNFSGHGKPLPGETEN